MIIVSRVPSQASHRAGLGASIARSLAKSNQVWISALAEKVVQPLLVSALKFGIEKVIGGQNICSRDASVGNGKNYENKLGPQRDNLLKGIDKMYCDYGALISTS